MNRGVCVAGAVFIASVPGQSLAQDGDWSGFYVGLDAGLGAAELEAQANDTIYQLTNINPPGSQPITVVPATTRPLDASERGSNFVYGGLAGFQLQSGDWVFGLEADIHGPRDLATVGATHGLPPTLLTPAGTVQITREAHSKYDWSARARIGGAFGRTLVYGTGGVAGTRLRLTGQDTMSLPAGPAPDCGVGCTPFTPGAIGPIVFTAREEKTMIGWTGGLGGEHRVTDSISIGLDGRYSDFGSETFALAGGCGPNNAAAGGCPNSSLAGPTITFPAGTTPVSISPTGADVYPGAAPGPTAVRLNEWRVVARVILRFGG